MFEDYEDQSEIKNEIVALGYINAKGRLCFSKMTIEKVLEIVKKIEMVVGNQNETLN